MIKKLLIFAAIAVLFVGVQAGTAGANLVLNGDFSQVDGNGDPLYWTQSNANNTFSFVGQWPSRT